MSKKRSSLDPESRKTSKGYVGRAPMVKSQVAAASLAAEADADAVAQAYPRACKS